MLRWLALLPYVALVGAFAVSLLEICEITKFDEWVACCGIMESGCLNQSGGSHAEGADTKDSISRFTYLLVYVVNK
jgi:hypothetical protein